MNNIFLAAALAAALLSVPAIAQQGPAGVPGAPAMVKEITSPPPAAQPPSQKAKRGSVDCSKAKDVAQCQARQDAHQKVLEACKDKSGADRKQCMQKQTQNVDCNKSRNPQQCEARKQAYAACKGKTGAQFRQCVQEKMPPIDCSTSAYPARCEQHQKVREICKNKVGQEHRQCLRDNLATKK